MALPLFPPNYPVPSSVNGAQGQHFDIDSGFAIASFPNGTPGHTFFSDFVTGHDIDTLGLDVVVVDTNVADQDGAGGVGIREIFSGTSLRETFIVGRDAGVPPVEGVTIRANPTHKNKIPSGVTDTAGYALFLTNVLNVLDAPARETFKTPRFRLVGNRGRQGGDDS